MTEVLEVSSREGTGKGAARTARREGMVPGVIYGGGKDPQPISIKQNVLLKRLHAGRFTSSLLTVSVDGKEESVICRAVQRDVVKDLPIHADFLRLSERSRISLFIHVEFINHEDCPGLKRGGTLQVVRPEVELRVTAGSIPEKLVCDLSGLELGDTIHISQIELPKGTRTTIDRDFVVANIAVPSGLAAAGGDEDEETGAEEDAAEETGEETPAEE